MTVKLTANQARWLRMRAQLLESQPTSNSNPQNGVTQVVERLAGLQAQDIAATALALRVRTTGSTLADFNHAQANERGIVRTWAWRVTLHLLPTADLGWFLPLFSPVFIATTRTRRKALGLSDVICEEGTRLIQHFLARNQPATRAEIVQHLAAHGLPLQGQAIPYLIGYTALLGITCLAAERAGKPTYVLLDDWLGGTGWRTPQIEPSAAITQLTLRYLAGYAPATLPDFTAWCGLPVKEIKVAWQQLHNEGQTIEVEIEGESARLLPYQLDWLADMRAEAPPTVRLLPAFDNYLLGYRNRDLIVEPVFAKRINAGGGMLQPILIADGQVVATWKISKSKAGQTVEIVPFEPLSTRLLPALEAEIADLARFTGVPVTLAPF